MDETLNRHYSNNIGTTATTVFTAPAHSSSGTQNMSVICGMVICNTHSASVTVDAYIVPGGTSTQINILNNVEIKAGNSVEAIQARSFLKHDGTNADTILVRCDTGSHADVFVSTLEGLN